MAKRKRVTTAIARRGGGVPAQEKAPAGMEAFERLARDKRLTVEKLGELIALQERIMERNARQAFDAAYQAMLPRIPRIKKSGKILNKDKQVQSRYSKYEDIREVVDPILREFGFQFYTRTEWPETGTLEVVGILTHQQGHSRESRFRSTADIGGGKNAIQGLGSGVSYGKRYALKDLLAIVDEGQDDDGQAFGSRRRERVDVVDGGAPPAAGHHATAQDVITKAQRQRFATVFETSGRNRGDVGAWIKRRYGFDSSAEITRDKYDEILAAIQSPKALEG